MNLFSSENVRDANWSRSETFFLAALLALTFLCYLPAIGYEFVYDDRLLILKNPAILSWSSVRGFFFTDFTSVAIPEAPAVYYRPVLLVWMMVNAKLWGMHPAPWHFTAIALHLIVVAQVYLLARRLLSSRVAAGAAAGLFALHPAHVECVAWVMAEAEQLTAALLLASLFAYFRSRGASPRRRLWVSVSLAWFSIALLIKENAIMLAPLVAVYEWFFYERARAGAPSETVDPLRASLWKRTQSSFLRAAPYFAVAAVYLAVREAVLKSLGHTNTPMSLLTFFATLPLVLSRYLKLLLWPAGLSVCYDIPYVHRLGFRDFVVPLVAVLLFAALVTAGSLGKRASAFAAVWLILPLLPALDLPVFFRSEIVHDRYLYFPSIGFALLVGAAFQSLNAHWRGRLWTWAIPVALLGLMAVATCYDRGFWKDNWTLFQRAVKVAPHNIVGLNNLGNEYADRGRFEEAIVFYRRVLAEYPPYWESAYNAGYCAYKLGRLEEAREFFQHAYELEPYDPDVCIYYGMTYFKTGQMDAAEALVRRAISLRPTGQGFHLALGMILREKGDAEDALREFRLEQAAHPGEGAAEQAIQQLSAPTESSPTAPPSQPPVAREPHY